MIETVQRVSEDSVGSDWVGIYDNLSSEEYHSAPGLSFSMAKRLGEQTPKHLQHYLKHRDEEEADALTIGKATHCLVLEPHLFEGLFTAAPKGMRRDDRTKAYQEFLAQNLGKEILKADDMEMVKSMADAITTHPVARQLLSTGKAEQSAFWIDPETGVLCKCRPDYLRSDGIIVDIKTSRDPVTPGAFQRTIASSRYHWQTAFYLDGLSQVLDQKLTHFVHIAVEKKAPYDVGLYELDDASIERAREDVRRWVKTYAHCLEHNEWPGNAPEIQSINLPSWAW